ncbi:ABC transporter ATP-binding protein [Mesorhizobium sp. WSM3862]|uniref:dipeptide ABC transporter ATP-binding protein n=1 Tax=Mesorhizobium sp. WSM3862 TaxID=632858 RepID=UPI000BAF8D0F|nr:ABC transporter ATP-binding protein [Mesorhizobium sp. WSM3862]PBB94729.1 ABC transporter ATP-binding protein [Mesorhizobium sp. WSM3862]
MTLASDPVDFLTVQDLALSSGNLVITMPTSFHVARGETLAIVGESGSGKSLMAKAIAGLLPPGVTAKGSVKLEGCELNGLSERDWQRLRGRRVSMLLQDPFTMLNPVMRAGRHLDEVLRDDPTFHDRKARRAEVERRLMEVGINNPAVADHFPFQLSGGMSQRIALASSLARDPEILIADEPSTALDVTTQAEIMQLLKDAKAQRGMSLILITHDLRLAFSICDRVLVLYAGSVVEIGRADHLGSGPFHPYSAGLLLSEPSATKRVKRLVAMPGRVPMAHAVAGQCAFADRCDWADERCRAARPGLEQRAPGRFTRCLRQPEIQGELDALRRAALEAAPPISARLANELPLVKVDAITKVFPGNTATHALKGVSFHIAPGESVGLVGESGSGKSTLGRCLVGLETPTTGKIEINGIDAHDFEALKPEDRAHLRRTVQMVFQDPYSTLNPRHSIGKTLAESLRAGQSSGDMNVKIARLLTEVGLTGDYAKRRPAQLSGGERQRIAIARALAVSPRLLVCDEPVSALDVSVQAQMLNLFKDLKATRGLSFLFITHDLAVVRQIADRIVVLYLGDVVEEGSVDKVLSEPQHPYTKRLVASVPTSRASDHQTESRRIPLM